MSELKTVGEHAADSLVAFCNMLDAVGEHADPGVSDAIAFVVASEGLIAHFPSMSKVQYAQHLPFSELELALLRSDDRWRQSENIHTLLVGRLGMVGANFLVR